MSTTLAARCKHQLREEKRIDESGSDKEELPREGNRFPRDGDAQVCGCGEEFFIIHNSASMNTKVAEKQAKWLEKVLAEEHERDKKHHPDRIELPD